MLEELIKNGQHYLNHFFLNLDLKATEDILNELEKCSGTVFFSGIGKSEVMAKKIAVTMTSTGTKAQFMAPTNALHGDIGMLAAGDLFVMLSRSGETNELIDLVPFVKNKGVKTIAIVSDEKSRLSKLCDMSIGLPLARELCPFNLVPTTSTQIQMIFGDILTVALMKRKNFTLDAYAENHPSGKIGRRINVKVEDLMLRTGDIPTCSPDVPLLNAIVELSKKRCGCVMVIDEERHLLGIFTDGDLGRSLNRQGSEVLSRPLSTLMNKNPKCISKDRLAWDALQKMEADPEHPITVLAVTDEAGKLSGVIKMHDILQAGV